MSDVPKPTENLHGRVPVVTLTREGINDLLRENNITYVRIQLNEMFQNSVAQNRSEIERDVDNAKRMIPSYKNLKASKNYDWERFEREATESDWIELWDNQLDAEQTAMEAGGLETWTEVVADGWDGLVLKKGDGSG